MVPLSREDLLDAPYGSNKLIDFLQGVIQIEGSSGSRRNAVALHHRLSAMMTGPDRHTLLVQYRAHVVRVDPVKRVARVDGGCTWGDFDHATHIFGLAAPGGIISTTGVGGLTLGGGFGYLTRRYGLACDNVISADVVTADGKLVTASAEQNQDLYWAIRGGSGNFGVVTSFKFRLYPVSMVYAGPVLYPLEKGPDVMRFFDSFMAQAPRELSAFFAYLIVPAVCGVWLSRSWAGQLVIGWVVAVASSLVGLATSYWLDLPTGAAIVCATGLALIIVSTIAALRPRGAERRAELSRPSPHAGAAAASRGS